MENRGLLLCRCHDHRLIVFSMTPIYTARATLLIERNEPQVVNIKQVLSESAAAEETSYYESQYQILQK